MNSIKILTAVVIFFAILTGNVFAQGEAGAEFLLISPGARAGGMGEANAAIANDATAVFWNPAGLANLEGQEFSIMHSNWLPQFNLNDLYYDFAAYVHNVEDIGTFGISATYLNLGEQIWMSEHNQELGTFSAYNMAVGLSYGTKVRENLNLGLTLKYLHLKLADSGTAAEKGKGSGTSVALDFGVLYRPQFSKKLTIGANLSNMGPKIAFIDADQADPLPTNLKLGFAYQLLERRYNNLVATIDFNKLLVVKHEDGPPDPFYKAVFTAFFDKHQRSLKRIGTAVGFEYWYSNLIALRFGHFYEDIGKRRFWTFGGGIRYSIYGFDFGYIAADKEGSPLADTMRFSLSFKF